MDRAEGIGRMVVVISGCALGLLLIACARSGSGEYPVRISGSPTPVYIEGAVRHELHAMEIGDDFVLDVYLPPDLKHPLPVVYLIDGNNMFPLAMSTVRLLHIGGEVPPVILVGIGYKESRKRQGLRNRDLTPTFDPDFVDDVVPGVPVLPEAEPGGADAFLNFIRDEVKPFVQANYPAKGGDDTLMGFSLGGLLTLHALLTRPEEYSRYVAGSPSLWWDDEVLFLTEAEYAMDHQDLAARLFISIGGLEQSEGIEAFNMVANMHRMADALTSRAYPSLVLSRYEFPQETHLSVAPATLSRGLREVFKASLQPKRQGGPSEWADCE